MKEKVYLLVTYRNETNPCLRYKTFSLKDKEKAFRLWLRKCNATIFLEGLPVTAYWDEGKMSEALWLYGKPEQWKEHFFQWIDEQLKFWEDEV